MGYVQVPEDFFKFAMKKPLCGMLETKLYLWFCFRRATQGRKAFQASLSVLAADFGLLVKSGPRAGKPDSPRIARALANLESLALISRKRSCTRKVGHQPSKITLLDFPLDPARTYPSAETSLTEGLPIR